MSEFQSTLRTLRHLAGTLCARSEFYNSLIYNLLKSAKGTLRGFWKSLLGIF